MTTIRDGKFAAGYRRCIAKANSDGWENPEFNGGIE